VAGKKEERVKFIGRVPFQYYWVAIRSQPNNIEKGRAIRYKSVSAQCQHTSGFSLLSLTQKEKNFPHPESAFSICENLRESAAKKHTQNLRLQSAKICENQRQKKCFIKNKF
jgi:hypothetical protein